ncbi:hypothetical protein GGI20_001140 [Coemansia sp. BCRC 34301]|nr:hypothetical protein GGI20_001140 [Coemansia sp. BCRC 34301]
MTTSQRLGLVDSGVSPAVTLVESDVKSDNKFPTVSELLHASSSGEYESGIPADWQVVTKQRLIALPDALFEQYELLECRCFMGLFPEIKRAWITVDHRLFLWNYEDESDFYSFDDQEQIIVSVGLVRPKAGVFVDTIKHVLVVATPLEVFLLGVGYEAGKVAGVRSGSGEVTLYATQISVPADGVAMTSICGTADGRVFMSGNDGALYEFAYQAEDGWLTKRAKKVNLTATIASYFMPTFLGLRRDTAALSMVVDDERRLAYVLLQDASVKVFWLGTDGSGFELVHHHRAIATSAALLCPQFNEGAAEGGAAFEIASLHVIPPHESRTLSLVAVTCGGARLYFSSVRRTQRLYEASALALPTPHQPEVFDVVHVRLAPDQRQPLNVHTAFYANGTALLAHAANEDHDSIMGLAPACAPILARAARQPRATLVEHASSTRVEGRTWAIGEIGAAPAGLNDLVGAPRTFAVLTNAGVSILEKQRPVDMLRALLARPTVQDAQIGEFVAAYGLDETCAMCFAILCVDEPHVTTMQALTAARRIVFEYGGVPRATSADPQAAVVLSGRHNGLARYLARSLQPVWARSATSSATDRSGILRLHVGIVTPDLIDVQERLRRLQHFIATNQRFVPDQLNQMPLGDSAARSSADIAACWQAEAASLGALYDLLVRSIEAISFLCLLADFNLPVISESMPESQRQLLAGIPFSQLVASDTGRVACKDLILALINSQLKQCVSIDSISDVLSKRCASIFAADDVALYKSLEFLKLAADADEGAEAATLANEALALLTAIAATLSANQVRDICGQFEALGQFAAVAALALACARESDPTNDAIAFWDDGAPENDARETVYHKRMDCYKCVIDLLDKRRASMLNVKCLAQLPGADDALFQFALYDWLLDNGESALLFQMQPEHVEKYLLLEPRTLEKCDMLWHFYIHEGQFARACAVQRELACLPSSLREGFDIGLPRRIEYLSLSISNAKIAIDMVRHHQAGTSGGDGVNELTAMLRGTEDQLEIAQVQLEIQQQLRALGGHETLATELDSRLFSVTDLYDRFAQPLNMWDAMLLIFKAANHSEDAWMVKDIWRAVLRSVLDDELRTGLMAVAAKVAQLGARLYPSSVAFPPLLVARILIDFARERPDEYTPGFVADALVQANVPHWAVFDALHALYLKFAAESKDAIVADMLAREVAALATAWMASAQCDGSAAARNGDPKDSSGITEDSMPVMAVDEALTQYIISATINNNVELKNELQRVQEHLRRIF